MSESIHEIRTMNPPVLNAEDMIMIYIYTLSVPEVHFVRPHPPPGVYVWPQAVCDVATQIRLTPRSLRLARTEPMRAEPMGTNTNTRLAPLSLRVLGIPPGAAQCTPP